MTYLISTARESVDFASLYEGPNITGLGGPEGEFLFAIIRGLRQGHESHPNQEPVVRVMIGKFPVGLYSAALFARTLRAAVGPWLKVESASMRTQLTSWDHAKVLDVDGRAAIVGGMNYWSGDYLQTANPTNDLSMEVEGKAATDVSRFDDVLWTWTCDHRHGFHTDVTLLNLRDCVKVAKTQRSLPNGTVPMMVVGHLGNGISVPGQPYGRQSAPFDRPPAHGGSNLCSSHGSDSSDTNSSRSYEYRNPGEPALRALIQRAQKSIFISQQDLLSCLPFRVAPTEAMFDERLFAVLASKIVAGVPITIVLSAGPYPGYSTGFKPTEVAKILLGAVAADMGLPLEQAREKLCQDVGLATLRNGPRPTWPNGKVFSNHAKLVAVDDEAFYIGSQNLYPGRLQEVGVIVDNKEASNELNFSYLRPMWDWSKADAVINPATKKCDV
jgi:phosphatidylserine/phosphatidylglycerophosphate/cardiolipin synthase-like enzyme